LIWAAARSGHAFPQHKLDLGAPDHQAVGVLAVAIGVGAPFAEHAVSLADASSAEEEDFKHGAFEQGLLRRVCCVPTRRSVSVLDLLYLFQVDHRARGGTVFLEPFSLAELGGYFNDVTMRDVGLDLGGRQISRLEHRRAIEWLMASLRPVVRFAELWNASGITLA